MSSSLPVVLDDLSFDWPDGQAVLSHLTATFGAGRTGLIGANGTGKSTLLRLINGGLSPTGGRIVITGSVGQLPQDVTRGTATVSDLLGTSSTLRALRAIEAGSVEQADFDIVGEDWDIAQRARASLSGAGLPTDLDRSVSALSGGEAMLCAIIGLRLRAPDITVFDEPTNNLDLDARARVYELIDDWPGTLIIVSHDTDLLERVDRIAELHTHQLTTFGGAWSAFVARRAEEQSAAERDLRVVPSRC